MMFSTFGILFNSTLLFSDGYPAWQLLRKRLNVLESSLPICRYHANAEQVP